MTTTFTEVTFPGTCHWYTLYNITIGLLYTPHTEVCTNAGRVHVYGNTPGVRTFGNTGTGLTTPASSSPAE
jgi:hypothetical protein